MQSPSNSQLKAIHHGEGPMLVLAGPGSGKTFVIIQRLLNLIHERKVNPENILVISFSKASTLELKQRFQREFKAKDISTTNLSERNKTQDNSRANLSERNKAKDHSRVNLSERNKAKDHSNANGTNELGQQVDFATFHACFFHILKETYHYTSGDIITEKQKRDLLRTILLQPKYANDSKELIRQHQKKELGREEEQKSHKQAISDEIRNITEKIETYLSKISYYKNKGTKELREKESKLFQQIFQEYNQEMHRLHKLDFDDMGLLCLQLLQTRPEVLEKWQDKFQYILIDEFQDINVVQFYIVQLLAKKYQNLFVVGDDDQSIYNFRGANPKIMLDFEKYYPRAEKVLLETNYRCNERIVKESLKVIKENKVRFQKKIIAFHKESNGVGKENHQNGPEGRRFGNIMIGRHESSIFGNKRPDKKEESVIYQGFEDYQKEYSYMGEQIQKMVLEHQYKYSDIVCIFRTNQNMMGLGEYFVRNKIPFVMKEACNSIFKHFIALDILAYLRFFLEGKRRSDFIRIMNKPLRYFSGNALSALSNDVIVWEELKQYYDKKIYMARNIEVLQQNEKWIQQLDLYGACFYIRKVIGYEAYLREYIKEQNMNWEEAKEILEFVQESTRGITNLEEWKSHIEEFEEALKNSDEQTKGVHMITMHACKGLEYPVVFLPDCNEGKIPHKKAALPEEIEEERRLFYVAMTRAKFHLEILYIEDKLKKHLQPSRFLNHHRWL